MNGTNTNTDDDANRGENNDDTGRVCDACGKSFATLSRLRMHETDDCPQRENYGELDPDDPEMGEKAAEGLLTCRNCGEMNGDVLYDQTMSLADDDLHMIIEFTCTNCGFSNENRTVMTGIDTDQIEELPPHLRPSGDEGGVDVDAQ